MSFCRGYDKDTQCSMICPPVTGGSKLQCKGSGQSDTAEFGTGIGNAFVTALQSGNSNEIEHSFVAVYTPPIGGEIGHCLVCQRVGNDPVVKLGVDGDGMAAAKGNKCFNITRICHNVTKILIIAMDSERRSPKCGDRLFAICAKKLILPNFRRGAPFSVLPQPFPIFLRAFLPSVLLSRLPLSAPCTYSTAP